MIVPRLLAWVLTQAILLSSASIFVNAIFDVDSTNFYCITETPESPMFLVSPGMYAEDQMTSTICITNCAWLRYDWAGIDEEGQACLCAKSIEGAIEDASCDQTCTGSSEDNCGGVAAGTLQVWSTRSLEGDFPKPDITLVFDDIPQTTESKTINEGDDVTVNAKGPADLDYYLDFGDGTNPELFTFNSSNGEAFIHTYPDAGEFVIKVNTVRFGAWASLGVNVADSGVDIEFECPELSIVDEPFVCKATNLMGSTLKLTMTTEEDDHATSDEFLLPEFYKHHYGWTKFIDSPSNYLTSDTTAPVVINSEFPVGEDEYLQHVKTFAHTDITVYSVWESSECSSTLETCSETALPTLTCESQTEGTCGASGHLNLSTSASLSKESVYTGSTADAVSSMTTYRLAKNSFFAIEGTGIGALTSESSYIKDHLLDSGGAAYDSASDKNFLARVTTAEGMREIGPSMLCELPSSAPKADFLVDGSNAEDILKKGWIYKFKIEDATATKSVELNVTCHSVISIGDVVSDFYGSRELDAEIMVPILMGGPVVINITVDDGSDSKLFGYEEDALKDPNTSLEHILRYRGTAEGHFTVTGYAYNSINATEFTTKVHIIPVIKAEDWEVIPTMEAYAIPPGEVTFVWSCSGIDVAPWNVTFNISNEDGSMKLPHIDTEFFELGTDGVAGPYTKTFEFKADLTDLGVGTFNVFPALYNEVSLARWNVTVILLEAIEGIDWDAGFELAPGSPLIPPGGKDANILPANITVRFKPSVEKGAASVSYWGLYHDGDLITNTSNAEDDLIHEFKEEGIYNITIKAYSEAEGWVEEKMFSYEVLNKVQGMQVTDFNIISQTNETKRFQASFEALHPLTCLFVDWNDGTLDTHGDETVCEMKYPSANYTTGPLTSPYDFTKIYYEENLYNITFIVVDLITMEKLELPVVVAWLPCDAPIVWVIDNVTQPSLAPESMRSRDVRVESDSIVNCTGSVATSKEWGIQQVSELDGSPIKDIVVKEVISSWNFSMISIPPRFLEYGTYLVSYRLQLLASKIFPLFRISTTYIKIVKSPLLASMIEGGLSKVSRGYSESILLEPVIFSEDPDYPEEKVFNYTWFCRRTDIDPEFEVIEEDPLVIRIEPLNLQDIPEPYTVIKKAGGGCFGEGPGTMNYKKGVLNLNLPSLTHYDVTYEILVMIHKDTRFALTKVQVKVLKEPPAKMEIKCADPNLCIPTFGGVIINPSSRIALASICTDFCHPDMTYRWALASADGQSVIESRTCGDTDNSTEATTEAPPEEPEDKQATLGPDPCPPLIPTGKESMDIAIGSDFFTENDQHQSFTISLFVELPTGVEGEYVMTIKLNQPPYGGSCKVEPPSGLSMIDDFIVSCQDWKDPEDAGIDQYSYFVYDTTDSGPVKRTIVAATQPRVELLLPVGNFTLFCDIWDKYGTFAEYEVGVIESIMPNQTMVDEYNVGDVLEYLSATGNQFKIGMLLTAQASVRENADWLSLDASAFDNLTIDEQNVRLREIAMMNKEALKTAKDTMSFATLSQLNVGAGVLKAATEGIMSSQAASKTVDMEARETAIAFLEKMTDDLDKVVVTTPNDLVPFLSASLGAMSSIMAGITEIIDGNVVANIPPTDQDAAADWDYEVDIGDDPTIAVPTTREEMLAKNVLDTTRLKSKTQVGQMLEVVKKIGIAMEKKSVTGETVIAQSFNGASMMVAKLTEQTLKNGMTVQVKKDSSEIVLPKEFCPSSGLGYGSCNQTFSITAVEWPGMTHAYSDSSKKLSKKGKIVSMDVFIKGQLASVKNQTRGIIVDVPRDVEELPEPRYVNETDVENLMVYTPLVYHQFNITRKGSIANVEIQVYTGDYESFVLLMDYERMPTPRKYSRIFHVGNISYNDLGVQDLFVDNSVIEDREGRFFIGVGVLKKGQTYAKAVKDGVLQDDVLDKEPKVSYSMRVFTSGCYFFEEKSDSWLNTGLTVVSATYNLTRCRSTHLTAFGSGFFPSPNSIDFEYVFANAGFTDNLTLYMSLIWTACCFLLLLIWARWKDGKDIQALGVTPLPDNQPEDHYLYEIVVYTGSPNEGGCKSNIQMIVSGEFEETDIRSLTDPKRDVFVRNGIDTFVMSTPRPLGDLLYLRIWHDNCGEGVFAGWNLAFVSVRDIQTEKKTLFIANRWLAIDREDGEIDVTLAASAISEQVNFSHLYEASKQKNLRDHNIWFSVFYRPPRSRYTRFQRAVVCAAFFYVTMCGNAIWYGVSKEESASDSFLSIGAFQLTPNQAYIGLLGLIMVYPIIEIVVFLFRRSEPFKRKPMRSVTASEEQRKQQREERGLLADEETEEDNIDDDNEDKPEKEERKGPFVLPWCFRYLAWLLTLGIIGVSIFFVWSYGIQFGAEKTSRWLTSLLIAYLASLLVVEPLMVIFGAAILSLCCKKSRMEVDADDIDYDEAEPELYYDEEWLHAHPMDPLKPRRVHKVEGNKDTSMLEELRQKLISEREMMNILYDIAAYMVFLFVLCMICYANKDSMNYEMVNNFRNAFIKEGDFFFDYKKKVINSDQYFLWLKNIMLTELRAQRWYNGEPPYGLRGFLDDRQNRIMGYAILRQVRNHKYGCYVPEPMNEVYPSCSGERGVAFEDDADYCINWKKGNINDTYSCSQPEFHYQSQEELESFPLMGRIGSYSGGGYVLRLKGSTRTILDRIDEIQKWNWIDRYTRVVMLEFSVYNANVNMFGMANVMAEFQPGGGIKPYWRFDATRMLKEEGTFGFWILLNQIGFILGIIYFTFKEFWNCYKAGPFVYFSSYWNMAEVSIIIVSYSAIAVYALREVELMRLLKIFKVTYGNGYIRMEYAANLDSYFVYMMGLIVFFSTLKLIKLLQFNNRLKLLGDTIARCWNDLRFFFLSFFISFFAFTSVFFFMFNIQLEDFADMLRSCEMCFSMMLGKFDFESMTQANALAPFLFFVFSVSTSMVLINMMLTIIMCAFSEVKAILLARKNKYDIMDFIIFKTRVLLGQGVEPRLTNITQPVHTEVKTGKDNEDFPDKVNMLLSYINDTYFHGQLDLKNTQALKSAVHRDMAMSGKKSACRSASFDRMFGDDIGVVPNFTHSAASVGRLNPAYSNKSANPYMSSRNKILGSQ